MQGRRGTVGSLPEMLNFDHGSTSSSVEIDEQIGWNNMQNLAANELTDYMLLPADANISYANSVRHNLLGWTIDVPSSSNTLNEDGHGEQKLECDWSSSFTGPRLEERQCQRTNLLPLDGVNVNPLFMPSSSSGAVPQSFNLNAGFEGHHHDSEFMEHSNLYKSNGLQNELISSRHASDPFQLSSRSSLSFVEGSDSRPRCSSDGFRSSRKRKTLEGSDGQSSASGSSSNFQSAEISACPVPPPWHNTGGSLNISTPSEQLNQRSGLGVIGVASESLQNLVVRETAENSHRNVRVRRNSLNQNVTGSDLRSLRGALRHHSAVNSEHSARLLQVGQTLDFRATPVADSTVPQNQSAGVHVSTLSQMQPSFRLDAASSSRIGGPSNSIIPGDTDVLCQSMRSRSSSRNLLEHPMVIPGPEFRNLVQNPNRTNISSGNTNIARDVGSGSTSQIGRTSADIPSSAPTRILNRNPHSRYSRRLSDHIRQSVFSSSGSEPGGLVGNHIPSHASLSSWQEMEHPSRAFNQGPHHSSTRLESWLRQGNAILGFPYPVRALGTGADGRRRFVSEIRNVLDLMRRGDGLRFEDGTVLDHSTIFAAAADIHDRHRDMRLDVDNMSYEELLALEERIGNVCTGLSEENISTRLKHWKYSTAAAGDQMKTEPCSICQEEYNDGEDLGKLECGHDFHANCIKQWLMHKNMCPICKTAGLST